MHLPQFDNQKTLNTIDNIIIIFLVTFVRFVCSRRVRVCSFSFYIRLRKMCVFSGNRMFKKASLFAGIYSAIGETSASVGGSRVMLNGCLLMGIISTTLIGGSSPGCRGSSPTNLARLVCAQRPARPFIVLSSQTHRKSVSTTIYKYVQESYILLYGNPLLF